MNLVGAIALVLLQILARPIAGTGAISGTVMTDEPSSKPVRRSVVTIFIAADPKSQRTVTTDDRGRFFFDRLPAGAYQLSAAKPAHLTTYYGAKRPGSNVGVPIVVSEGQNVANISVRLLHGAAITGVIVDTRGRPMPGVTPSVQRVTVGANGERALQPAIVVTRPFNERPQFVASDDRGLYRVFGLPPGDYVVSATPRDFDSILNFFAGGTDVRAPTPEELQWALRQIQSASGAATPASSLPPAPGKSVTYATVFHPGTTDSSTATVVTVAAGQERSGVDMTMQVVTTSRVEGRVLETNGQPAPSVLVSLTPRKGTAAAEDTVMMIELGLVAATNARPGPDGAFSIANVQPGAYTLLAWPAAGRGAPPPGTPPASAGVWAEADVDVAGNDISGLSLVMQPGMTVTGRAVLQGADLPLSPDSRITIRLTPVKATGAGTMVGMPVPITGRETPFVMAGVVPGKYRVSTTWGAGGQGLQPWTLTSAMIGGRDVADVPLEIKPAENAEGLVVTLTDTPGEVSGVLYDATNKPSADLSIIVFTTDKSMWFQGSRRLRAPVRAASNGTFAFTALPAGEYYLAALTDFEPTDWYNREFLDQVAASAIKFTIAAGEKKKQDLRIGR